MDPNRVTRSKSSGCEEVRQQGGGRPSCGLWSVKNATLRPWWDRRHKQEQRGRVSWRHGRRRRTVGAHIQGPRSCRSLRTSGRSGMLSRCATRMRCLHAAGHTRSGWKALHSESGYGDTVSWTCIPGTRTDSTETHQGGQATLWTQQGRKTGLETPWFVAVTYSALPATAPCQTLPNSASC